MPAQVPVADVPAADVHETPADLAPKPDKRVRSLTETSVDLFAVPDEPAADIDEIVVDPAPEPDQSVPSLTDTSLDLFAVRDEPRSDVHETAADLAKEPDSPVRSLTDTSFDLVPVRDEPEPDVHEIGPERDEPAPGLTDTSLDLTPVHDEVEPVRDVTDTAFDLAPVRDDPVADGEPAEHGGPGGAADHAADGSPTKGAAPAAIRAPVPPRRPAHGGAHAGTRVTRARATAEGQPVPRRLPASRQTSDPRWLAPTRLTDRGLAWRPAAGATLAGALLVTVIPLALLQVPYAPLPQIADAGATAAQAGGPTGVLRAASLALPFAVSAAPLAALAVRRLRAWPVLFAGLLVIVVGAWLSGLHGAGTGFTGALPATVGAVRGIGAGLAIPATVALVTEHTGLARRLLAACWAAVAVAALAVLPGLGSRQATGWQAALGPVPWLTIVALAAALAYPALAGGIRAASDAGNVQTPGSHAERVRLVLLAPAAAALSVIAIAVTYRQSNAITVAAACAVAGLLVMAVIAVRGAPGGGIAVMCAVTGFLLAPASVALAGLRAMAGAGAPSGTLAAGTLLAAAAAVGALAGAGTAAVGRRAAMSAGPLPGTASARSRHHVAPGRTGTSMLTAGSVFGLLLAAAALVVASMTGPFAGPAVLAVLVAAVTGGLAAALARPAFLATTAGAMTGVVMLAAGALAGSLAAAAIRVWLAGLTLATSATNPAGHLNRTAAITAGSSAGPATGPDAVPHGLVTAAGWWELAGASIAVVVVFAWCAGRARANAAARWQPRHGRRGAPERGIDGTTGWGADEGADRKDHAAAPDSTDTADTIDTVDTVGVLDAAQTAASR